MPFGKITFTLELAMAVKVPVLGFLLRLPASSPSSAMALDEEGAPPAADTVCTADQDPPASAGPRAGTTGVSQGTQLIL